MFARAQRWGNRTGIGAITQMSSAAEEIAVCVGRKAIARRASTIATTAMHQRCRERREERVRPVERAAKRTNPVHSLEQIQAGRERCEYRQRDEQSATVRLARSKLSKCVVRWRFRERGPPELPTADSAAGRNGAALRHE